MVCSSCGGQDAGHPHCGIHFRTADVQGAVLGKKVAHLELKHYFQPVG
jgi:hypothetical protein